MGQAGQIEWDSWFFSKEQLEQSPSRADGVTKEQEDQLRGRTCAFVNEVGKRLKLPQLTIATAIVYFHRFFARHSFKKKDRVIIATACIFLSAKVEESPRKLCHLIIQSHQVLTASRKIQGEPMREGTKEYSDLREKILAAERNLLITIGFDFTVDHSYKHVLKYRKEITGSPDILKRLGQVAWNFVNDRLVPLDGPPRQSKTLEQLS
jgi:cyclin T